MKVDYNSHNLQFKLMPFKHQPKRRYFDNFEHITVQWFIHILIIWTICFKWKECCEQLDFTAFWGFCCQLETAAEQIEFVAATSIYHICSNRDESERHKIDTRDRRLCLKPALVQDTDFMVEKTYHIAPYLGAFGAYLMPQWPIYGSKGVSI